VALSTISGGGSEDDGQVASFTFTQLSGKSGRAKALDPGTLEVALFSGGRLVGTSPLPAEPGAPAVSGIPVSGDLLVGFGIEAPKGKVDEPYVLSTRSVIELDFPEAFITLSNGFSGAGDEVVLRCPDERPVLCPSGQCVESATNCPTPGAIPPAITALEITHPEHFLIGSIEGYDSGDTGDDLGLPPSTGGLFEVGESVCFEIPDALATGIRWSKDGTPIAGATSRRLCLVFLTQADSGTYRAVYDDGSKAPATYSVTITVANTLPLTWWPAALALLLVLVFSARPILRYSRTR